MTISVAGRICLAFHAASSRREHGPALPIPVHQRPEACNPLSGLALALANSLCRDHAPAAPAPRPMASAVAGRFRGQARNLN